MSVRSFMSGLSRLGQGDIEQAIAYHETIAKFPRDLASIQRGQYHYFYLGNKESLLQIAEKVLLTVKIMA